MGRCATTATACWWWSGSRTACPSAPWAGTSSTTVRARSRRPGTSASSCVPRHAGQGLGTEAQRLLAEFLFATYDLNRVEASTDVENLPEQRSLEKAGFVREGIQRGAQFRAGAYHDLVTYSRLRDDR